MEVKSAACFCHLAAGFSALYGLRNQTAAAANTAALNAGLGGTISSLRVLKTFCPLV